jgi:hypothetical protein
MKIPPKQLESTKRCLHHLVDERTSALWASYGDEDISVDEQDREDIEKIQTVADVLEWLQNQGSQKTLVEWASCLDPLDQFAIPGKEYPDERDEGAFRDYLRTTYGVNPQ